MGLKDDLVIRMSSSVYCEMDNDEIADELDTDVSKVDEILKDNDFWKEVNEKIKLQMRKVQPKVNQALLDKCVSGDVQGIKFYHQAFCGYDETLNVKFGDLGSLDGEKFDEIYKSRVKFLEEQNNGKIDI